MQFRVKIKFEIHSVTCPGVCLCPSGDVELSLTCLQYHFRTAPKSPRFPILLHETFTVNGFYREYFARREEFERMLSAEPLECNLWQNGRRLAHFKGPLINLLDSDSVRTLRSSGNGFPCDLILKPSTCFPGIIGPKCVMRVEMDVVERHQKSTSAQLSSAASMALWANWRPHRSHSCWPTDDGYDESAGPLSSVTAAATVPHCKKCRRLQKPVCHARQRCTTRIASAEQQQHKPNPSPSCHRLSGTQRDDIASLDERCHCISGHQSTNSKRNNRNDHRVALLHLQHQTESCEICRNYRYIFNIRA